MTARIAPLAPPYDSDTAALLARLTPPQAPEPLALFRLLARHPPLATRMAAWGGFLLRAHDAALPLRDREVVIHRVSARCGAGYEFGVHAAAFGPAAGFTPAQLQALADPQAEDAPLTPRDRLLVEVVDALHDDRAVDDALWARLTALYGEAQCIELLMLAGWYHAIAYVCTATRLPPEAWAAGTLPARP